MQLDTSRFGPITIDPATIIHFPLGLLGFETVQRYVLVDSDQVAPMRWLQAVDDPRLAFLVVEPGLFFPDYAVELTDADQAVLEAKDSADLAVACLVVVPEDPTEMTINLMGPLVMNSGKRLGKQVVMHDGQYSPRQRLLPDEAQSEEAALV